MDVQLAGDNRPNVFDVQAHKSVIGHFAERMLETRLEFGIVAYLGERRH